MIDDDVIWALRAARAADDKLGADTTVVDVGDVLGITGYFVITSGRNRRQVRAIAEAIGEDLAHEGGPRPLRVEGLDDCAWVLLDFGGFVIHVFDAETRAFYDLDRLWSDRPRLDHAEASPASPHTSE